MISKKKKEIGLDEIGINYKAFIENNRLYIKLELEETGGYLFEYHLYSKSLRIDKITYTKNINVMFVLRRFGNLKVRIFVKKADEEKARYSFISEYVDYNEITAIECLNEKGEYFEEAKSGIKDILETNRKKSERIENVIEKIQGTNSFEHNIIEYLLKEGINRISIYTTEEDKILARMIWVMARLTKDFNIKYLLSNAKMDDVVKVPRKVAIKYYKLKEIFEFDSSDYILVCTAEKDKKFLKKLKQKTKTQVVHLADLLTEVFDTNFVLQPLLEIKNKYPEIPIVVCFPPRATEIKNKSKNEFKIASSKIDIDKIRKEINMTVPIIPLALERFQNPIEKNRNILEAVYKKKENGNTYFLEDLETPEVNVINNHRVTTDQPEKFDNIIHVFGNSVAFGRGNSDEDTICSYLQRCINNYLEKDKVFTVLNCSNYAGNDHDYQFELIKKEKYKRGDIIITLLPFNVRKLIKGDFYICETQEAFERPHDMGEVFIDIKHTNSVGNKKIAEILFNTIEEHKLLNTLEKNSREETVTDENNKESQRKSGSVVEHLRENPDLIAYKTMLKEYEVDVKSIGAIVMNCNPFTLGHRYLIESSSKQVEHLYVFVVEEDKSFFPFRDRFNLVKKGTEDLTNVTVIPSGKFIISSITFSDYFNKEKLSEKVINMSDDVTLFGEEIASVLNIKKRFLGEEPLDNITRQYNNTLSRILPEYGIEVEIIKRKEANGEVISASRVRNYLEKKQFDKIKEIVPSTTYDYLIEKFT